MKKLITHFVLLLFLSLWMDGCKDHTLSPTDMGAWLVSRREPYILPQEFGWCVRGIPSPAITDSTLFKGYRFDLLSDNEAYETMEIDDHTFLEIWHMGCEYYSTKYTFCFNDVPPNTDDAQLYRRCIGLLRRIAPHDFSNERIKEGADTLEAYLQENDVQGKSIDLMFEPSVFDFHYQLFARPIERRQGMVCVPISYVLGPL